MPASNQKNSETKDAWGASLAFWLCLIVSAGLYAGVALSPKLWMYLNLRSEHNRQQARLVAIEQQINYMKRVGDALESESQFASELARIDFDAVVPGDEHIAVDVSLTLAAPLSGPPEAAGPAQLPWYSFAIRPLATHRKLRAIVLALSALIVIGAFTFLHESTQVAGHQKTMKRRPRFESLQERYRKA
jgi:hypothetical protein